MSFQKIPVDQIGLARKTLNMLAAVISITRLTLIYFLVQVQLVLYMTSILITQLMEVITMTVM